MGFPVGYTEFFVPKLFLHLLSLLGFIRSLIISLFHILGLQDFLETDMSYSWPEHTTTCVPASAMALREILPVMKLEELRIRRRCELVEEEEKESCAVCLCDIEEEEEIRLLENCKHIFHRCCVDRWMDHEQTTCPLCRTPFVSCLAEPEVDDHQHLWITSELSGNQFF